MVLAIITTESLEIGAGDDRFLSVVSVVVAVIIVFYENKALTVLAVRCCLFNNGA